MPETFPNLDYLRTVAVMLVVLVHTMVYTGYIRWVGWAGTLGVGIFFVHTTLVLMMSLERDNHTWRFYVRRAFRIYPLWLAILAIYLLFKVPLGPGFAPAFGFKMPGLAELLANIFLTFDFHYGGGSIVCASWSLPLEVQMYIVLPALFFLAMRWRSVWLFVLIDAAAIAFDIYRFRVAVTNLPMAFPYFLPGVMAFLLYRRVTPRLPSWTLTLWLAVICAVGYEYGDYRKLWYICLSLGLSLPFFRQITWKPLLRGSHLIARYSYGIYLTHGLSIALAVYLLRGHSLTLRVITYATSFVVMPVIFYHAVEKPMIRAGAHLAKKIGRGSAPRMNERTLSMEVAP